MKIEKYVPSEKKQPTVIQQQKVQYKQLAGGGVKKTITPKIVQTF